MKRLFWMLFWASMAILLFGMVITGCQDNRKLDKYGVKAQIAKIENVEISTSGRRNRNKSTYADVTVMNEKGETALLENMHIPDDMIEKINQNQVTMIEYLPNDLQKRRFEGEKNGGAGMFFMTLMGFFFLWMARAEFNKEVDG